MPLYTDLYTFSGSADQAMRLWIDGKLVANFWDNAGNWSGVWSTSSPIQLTAGQKYDIRLDYWNDGCCFTTVTLRWSSTNQPGQIIPASQLYPETQTDTIGMYKSPGIFFLHYSNATGNADRTVTLMFALAGDLPVTGDWDGDGVDGIGVFRPSNGQWLLVNNPSTSFIATPDITFVFGVPDDQPLAGHWKYGSDSAGIIRDGIGVFRPSNGLIYLKNDLTTGNADFTMAFGAPGDKIVTGDWNGDGVDSLGIFRPSISTFYLSNAREVNGAITQNASFIYGASADIPFSGNWIGHGASGMGMFAATAGTVKQNNNLVSAVTDRTFTYGDSSMIPLAGKWSRYEPYKINIIDDGTRQWAPDEITAINDGVALVGQTFDLVDAKLITPQPVLNTPQSAFNKVMIENSGTELLFIRTAHGAPVTITNYHYLYGTKAGQTQTLMYTNTNIQSNACTSLQETTVNNTILPAAIICSGDLTDHFSGPNRTLRADEHTITHELGHIFDYRTLYGLSMPIAAGGFKIFDCNNQIVMDTRRGRRGWGTGPGQYLNTNAVPVRLITDFQQDSDNLAIENAADSFLNWVYRLHTSAASAVDSCALTPIPAYNQWTGPGFLNLQWPPTLGGFIANSAGAPGTPDASLPGDERYWDIDKRIRQIFTNNHW